MKESISKALKKALERIKDGYSVESEADFQAVLFGELYRELPCSIVKFEKKLENDYQSYTEIGKKSTKRKSRVDLHIESAGKVTAIEVKYFKGGGAAVEADMIADIAKLERIVEAKEANEGFCVQLVKPGVINRLPKGSVKVGRHQPDISGWNYDFEIKGQYQINSSIELNGYSAIVHHISECT